MVRQVKLEDALRFHPREQYLTRPMPTDRDEQITRLLGALRDERAIAVAAGSVAALGDTVLSPYVQRAAALAVRHAAPRYLRAGLRAAALLAADGDPRDVVVVLALLWRSAELLTLDPSSEFGAVAREIGRYGAPLTAFAARPPEARTIHAMRYVEVGEGADFRYECRW
ncbi:hypothetical protein ACN27G_21440 [Plantactinospora sp. WMMB334]|uniref:hypothetical protein n=1 Tax=Plantactinospora sp. WMMB334 TaxID=3404119 RepID=UPI003B927592